MTRRPPLDRERHAGLLDRATLTTSQVAELLDLGSPDAARVQLRRWALRATGRDVETSEKTWPTGDIVTKAWPPKNTTADDDGGVEGP